jgi:arginyl-tRNA synthetase
MVRLYLLVREKIKLAEDVEQDPEKARQVEPRQLEQSRAVLKEIRTETSRLHAGDPENRRLWEQFMPWCYEELDVIYRRLNVHFDHCHGESFYQDMLANVVAELQQRGIARESEGAIAVFFGEGEPPALVRYRSGAYTYTTTDLATIRYRMEHWQPNLSLYVVGSPQALHYKNLFAIARRWDYEQLQLEHIAFGSVLGPQGKVLRTREGGAPELQELLDEAVRHAARIYEENRLERIARGEEVPVLGAEELKTIHEVIGIGAVKYADLATNRTSDYIFDPAKMTALNGNTATYMQYAYVRNRGIFRKGEVDADQLRKEPPLPTFERPEERNLGLQLLRFEETLQAAAAEHKPNLITAYLWDLAKAYSGFFTQCPVLKAPTPELRQSRLLLCDLTARVIQKGLALLGIGTVERM